MTALRPLLVSNDPDLIDDVLRLAAANGVEVHLAPDPESARGRWLLAPLVLVGADLASAVAAVRPSRRRDVVLVARTPTAEDWQCAVALGAEHVASLPDAERWLIDRLADCGEGAPRNGQVLAVMGAGAGSGASTLAATLALASAARSQRVLLVDADPLGGGLDLLLGIEDAPGIRWPDLAASRGRLSAHGLMQALPHASGVSVLAGGGSGDDLTVEAMTSVLDAGARGFDLVVVDLPRQVTPATECVLARAQQTLLVVAPRVRATAAAAHLAEAIGPRTSVVGAVVRGDRGALSEDAMLAALPVDVVGRLPYQPGLAARSDEGEPPSLRDAYGRACQQVLGAVTAPTRAAG